MHTTLVHVHVKPEHVGDFVAATRANHLGAVAEPGNLRFDILQQADDPTRFVLYEVYASADAAAAHKHTGHYLKWRDAVQNWMASPREGVPHVLLYPENLKK